MQIYGGSFPKLIIGGRNFSSEPPIQLVAHNTSGNSASSYRKIGLSAPSTTVYTPGSTNAFYCQAIRVVVWSAAGTSAVVNLGSDSASYPYDSGNAFTSPIFVDGSITNIGKVIAVPAVGSYELAVMFRIANGRYPFHVLTGSAIGVTTYLYGYEAA